MNPALRVLLITTICSLGTLTLITLGYSAYLGYSLNISTTETQLPARTIIINSFKGSQESMAKTAGQVWEDFYKFGFSNFTIYFQGYNFQKNTFLGDFYGALGIDTNGQNETMVNEFLQSHANYSSKHLPAVEALSVTYPLSSRNFLLNIISGYKMNHKVLDTISKVDPNHNTYDLTMISLGDSKFVSDVDIESTVYVPYGSNSTAYEKFDLF